MSTFDFRGLAAHVEVQGNGPDLVLLHAGGSSGAQWKRVVPLLKGDRRLIAPDLIGFGRTPAWPVPGELSHDLQADLIAAVIAHTADHTVDVVGHSYGGASAVRLVLRFPQQVRSLVLIEPILTPLLRDTEPSLFEEYRQVAEGFLECAQTGRREDGWRRFLDYRNGAGTWAAMPAENKARFLAQTAQTCDGFRSNLGNPTTLADFSGIEVPTTIVCGGDTTAPDRRVTELLRDAIGASRYVTIPGAAHMSPLTHPHDIAQIVRAHLERGGDDTEHE
jgi:pimeloyl-ACP methyl ester carboxylesterase